MIGVWGSGIITKKVLQSCYLLSLFFVSVSRVLLLVLLQQLSTNQRSSWSRNGISISQLQHMMTRARYVHEVDKDRDLCCCNWLSEQQRIFLMVDVTEIIYLSHILPNVCHTITTMHRKTDAKNIIIIFVRNSSVCFIVKGSVKSKFLWLNLYHFYGSFYPFVLLCRTEF